MAKLRTEKKKSLKDTLPLLFALLGYAASSAVPCAMNGSPWLSLFLKLLLCVPLVVYVWLPAERLPVPQKIFLSGSVLLSAAAAVFLRNQAALLVHLGIAAALLVLILAVPGKATHRIDARALLIFLLITVRKSGYTFPEGGIPPFLIISVLLGMGLAVLLTIRLPAEDRSLKSRWPALLIFTLLCTLMMNLSILHLNYALDTEPPQEYAVEIEDKKTVRRRSGRHSHSRNYKFEVTAEGNTFWIEVSSDTYELYEIGDTYPIRRYAGAFGKPFFLAGSGDS